MSTKNINMLCKKYNIKSGKFIKKFLCSNTDGFAKSHFNAWIPAAVYPAFVAGRV